MQIVDERIFTIVSRILVGPTANAPSDGQRLPPGLSVIEPELVQLVSKYLAVTIHNTKSFGQLYLKHVNALLNARQQANSLPPSLSPADNSTAEASSTSAEGVENTKND